MQIHRHHPDTSSGDILGETIKDVRVVSDRCRDAGHIEITVQLNTAILMLQDVQRRIDEMTILDRV